METDGANPRRQIDSSEQAVEAMDTQESDIVNETRESNPSPPVVAPEDATMQLTEAIVENKNNVTYIMEDNAPADPIAVGTPVTAEEIFCGLAEDVQPENQDDDIRSEAVFSFTVNDFSKIKDSTLSPPTMVRNLPWKIMVMPRQERSTPEAKSLGFFLQCNGDSESTSWSCNAAAELRLRSFKPNQEPFFRKIKHLFYSKENDWGFSYFISWNEILDPEKGYVQNDSIVLEVHVVAEAPHGVFWDSKKHTGYVGLRNQGATCYMNSLLQTLYFTNQLRKAVYKMPTEADDSSKSVGLALQRVFHDLQVSDKPVGTRKLTKSFGWETLDSFMQHDVQEFLRVLLDKLESKMKGTCVEGTVPRLFEGKMSSYIKCKNVDYSSTRCETFYDIQLNIKGKKNIYESFQDYIAAETLEGDNKYDAAIHGLQEAEKGVIFTAFPPVLHLHLMRFQYDPITDNSVKFNDRFEFYEQINLDRFLETKEATAADYKLHAVLVHSGDNHGGHYVVYINPMADGEWCKFDDDVVSTCTKTDAIDHNYGGMDDEMAINAKHCSNAYMLVYIRVSELPNVLEEINQRDIPTELFMRLTEEKRLEQARRKERNEHSLIITVNVHLEDSFESHQSPELFDSEKQPQAVFRIKKTQPFSELLELIVDAFKMPPTHIRIWPLAPRTAGQKFIYFDIKEEFNRLMSTIVDNQGPWVIFLERALPSAKGPLLPFDKRNELLVFLKFYDPVYKRLDYIGHRQFQLSKRLCDIFPDVNYVLGSDITTELAAYEECSANVVQKLTSPMDPLEKVLSLSRDELQGNIIIFEKKHVDEKLELPTVEDYFRDLLYRIEILFVDKSNPNDPGFPIEISNRYTYYQMAQAVAQKINADPHRIQFFKCLAYKDTPGSALRCMYDGNIKDLLSYGKPRTTKKIFYQKLSMNINELENKKQFKCLWLTPNLKDEKELTLFPNKNANVKNLLEEAAKTVDFSENGTRKLRLVEIATHKLLLSPKEDTLLETLQSSSETMTNQQNLKSYRIEEIPADELSIAENEMLIPVSHFTREVFNSFGIPFFIKAKQDEPYSALKERIQKRLGVPDKEWEKFKFAIVNMSSVDYINDDKIPVNLDSYRLPLNSQPGSQLPFFGLEHINKTQKRGRYSYLEKAIKIYN